MARQTRGNSARGAAAPQSRRANPLLTGLVMGILVGLAAALGVALYLNRAPSPFAERKAAEPAKPAPAQKEPVPAASPAPAPASGAAPQPPEGKDDLQFHEILRGPKDGRDGGREPKPGPVPVAAAEQVFYVQVASLSSAAEADTLKVQLVLAGFEPRIQSVQLEGGKMAHRVRLGPFANRADASNVLEDVKRKNQIEGRIIKENQSAPRSEGAQ
jgi:cell division protein FtsN